MAKIVGIESNSIAEELGVEIGDELIGFDGVELVDILDYLYYDAQEQFVMTIKSADGQVFDLEIEKYEDERIGLEFGEEMELRPMRCKNKCVFCFIDQMHKGMRDSLYVKDDDYRLSFVSGNYVTLTNCGEKELQRIAKLKLSPLYISVHCYDSEIKTKMIGNPEGAKLFEKMQFLVNNGIDIHAQIVLCKGLNDNNVLEETLQKLYQLGSHLKTVAVIPLGLSDHRQGLANLQEIDYECAIKTLDIVDKFNSEVKKNREQNLYDCKLSKGKKKLYTDNHEQICYCADEFYLMAQRELPDYESYGDFGQIEDGVGMCANFCYEFDSQLENCEFDNKKATIALVTGQAFKNILNKQMSKIASKFPNIKWQINDIVNNYFGHKITVAGLITGVDILEQCKNLPYNVVIPSTMLKEFSCTFLDGLTVEDLQKELGVKLHICRGGGDLIKIISEVKE